MALSKSLTRKVDSENRTYKEEWKDNYAVILPSFVNAKKKAGVSYLQLKQSELFKLKALTLFQN